MEQFEVIFYEKENGEIPAQDFLLSLDVKMRVKLLGLIEILQEKGNALREPYSKYLADGIYELRGRVGNNISRVLYFFTFEKRIVLTNGFIKKTDKTPKAELEKARKYRDDYLKRSV